MTALNQAIGREYPGNGLLFIPKEDITLPRDFNHYCYVMDFNRALVAMEAPYQKSAVKPLALAI